MHFDTFRSSCKQKLVAFSNILRMRICRFNTLGLAMQILEEAHRLLRPGGALTIMEMNPYSPLVQNMVKNVFAFTAVSHLDMSCPIFCFAHDADRRPLSNTNVYLKCCVHILKRT